MMQMHSVGAFLQLKLGKVWEDNNGCIALANGQKFSPRTKHIGMKYHHLNCTLPLYFLKRS